MNGCDAVGPVDTSDSSDRSAITGSRRSILRGGALFAAGTAIGLGPETVRAAILGTAGVTAATRSRDGLARPITADQVDFDRLDELVKILRSRTFTEEHVEVASELLRLAGIAVDRAPDDRVDDLPAGSPTSPLRLLRWQVRQMAMEISARGGTEGSELDALIPMHEGAPPPSFLLAGYVAAAETIGGEIARRLMEKKNWAKAPQHRYPAMVFALCCSDLALDSGEAAIAPGRSDLRSAAPAVRLHAVDACTLVAGYVEQVVNAVFDALKVKESGSGVGKVLSQIWNFLVDLAQKGVGFVLDILTDAVLGVIKAIAGVIGIASLVLSALKVWAVSLKANPTETHFGVGAEAVQGEIEALVTNGGLDGWPAEIVSCASLGGVDLPELTPGGAKIDWALDESPIDLVQVADEPGLLADDARATLIYLTNNESPEKAKGEPKEGVLTVSITVQRPDIEQLKDAIADITFAAIPGIVAEVLTPILGGKVKEILSGLVALADLQGTVSVKVIYHEDPPTVTPEPPEADGSGCPFGDWEIVNFAEYAEGVATLAGADVSYMAAGGSTTISIASDKTFTWVFDQLSVIGTQSIEGMGRLDVILTLAGFVSGEVEIEKNELQITAISRDFSMKVEAGLDGVGLGEQDVDQAMFGLGGGQTMIYTCTDYGMAIEQVGVASNVPLELVPVEPSDDEA